MSRLAFRKPRFLARLAYYTGRAHLLRRPTLRFMDVAVDYACNMKCEHCSASNLMRSDTPKLTISEYKEIAEKLRKEGVLVFHFTGGEPLIRKDLEEIISVFKPQNCAISIQSNGLLATRERLNALKKTGLDILCISIDSGIPGEHEAFRRSPGSYDKAIAAVKTAKKLGLQTMVSTCVSHSNLHSEGLKRLIEFTVAEKIWCYFNLAVPAGNWRENDEVLFSRKDREDMERLIKKYPNCRTDFYSNFYQWGCGAVKEKAYLTSYGEIMPCPFIQVSLGNLREESISTIRQRALHLPEFKKYWQVCLAAEENSFIEKCPCYESKTKVLPIPYTEVGWMKERMCD